MTEPARAAKRLQRVETSLPPAEEIPSRRHETMSIEAAMRRFLVPGCSVAIMEDGEIVAARGYGVTGDDDTTPVTTSTIFQACSISKAVAGVGAMRLTQEGLLDLDEDVNRYLRSWQVPANDGWQPRVTLRHLLTHTAGLTYCWFPGHQRGAATPTALQIVRGEPPANTPPVRVVGIPGTEFRYSGAHFAVLELVMEEVTGEHLPDLMHRLVFEPLDMRDSSYDQDFPETRTGGVALGHDAAGVLLTGGWHVQPEHAGAGLWTTPSDLCRLALAIQAAWSGATEEFMSKETAIGMLTPGPGDRGLGWHMNAAADWLWFEHGGDNVGYKCALLADTARGRGAAIMTNGDAGWLVYAGIFSAIASEFGWPEGFVSTDTLGFRAPELADDPPDPAALTTFAGEYRLDTGLRLRITAAGNRLTLRAEGQAEMSMLPISASTFLAEAANVAITFDRASNGGVDSLRFRQFGAEIPGERIT